MWPSVAVLLLAGQLASSALAAHKVLHVPFEKRYNRHHGATAQAKRQTVDASLGNAEVFYFVKVSVGTPPQDLELVLDTGSSDVWMSYSQAAYCLRYKNGCPGGDFNYKASSTYQLRSADGFNISYVDGSGSSGGFFTDDYHISGATIKNLVMGLATQTTIGTGIMGISFPLDESVCNIRGPSSCNPYPSVMEDFVSQGIINSEAYSLWLDDVDSNYGSILFGGVDSSKYTGDLIAVPVQLDSQTRAYTSFTVALTGFSITTSEGERPINFDNALPAVLDSGTSVTYLPPYLAKQIFAQAGATYASQLKSYVLPCSSRSISTKYNPTFNYQFGGSTGPTIKVPWTELIQDIVYSDGSRPTNSNNEEICSFGIMPATGDTPILLGDTFLRSAYVVYDLSNRMVALAQTNFNPSGSSNIAEISSSGIPNVAHTASGITVQQTAAVRPVPGGGGLATPTPGQSGSGSYSTPHSGSSGGGSSGSSGGSSGNSGSTNSGSEPLSQLTDSANAAVAVPPVSLAGLAVVGVSAAFALCGGALLFV